MEGAVYLCAVTGFQLLLIMLALMRSGTTPPPSTWHEGEALRLHSKPSLQQPVPFAKCTQRAVGQDLPQGLPSTFEIVPSRPQRVTGLPLQKQPPPLQIQQSVVPRSHRGQRNKVSPKRPLIPHGPPKNETGVSRPRFHSCLRAVDEADGQPQARAPEMWKALRRRWVILEEASAGVVAQM